MINKITISNVASYKSSSTIVTDKKQNLFYGLNGTGKSTLSNYLYDINNPQYSSCSIEGLESNDKILVYNTQFVQDNFYETDDIPGIFTLNKENKKAQQTIQDANRKLSALTEKRKIIEQDINKLNKEHQKKKNQYIKNIWSIKTTYSGGDRVLEFCLDGYKNSSEALFSHLISIPAVSEEPSKSIDILKNTANSLFNNLGEKETISSFEFDLKSIGDLTVLTKQIVGSTNNTVSTLIDKLGNSDWVQAGLEYVHISESGAICPFCQQKTITSDFWSKLKEKFNEEYESEIKRVQEISDQYKHLQESAIIQLNDIASKLNKSFVKDFDASRKDFEALMLKNSNILQLKIEKPSQTINIDSGDMIINQINEIIDKNNEEIEEYNNIIRDQDNVKEQIRNDFWKLMRYTYASVLELYSEDEKHFTEESTRLNGLLDQNKTKQTELESLIESQKTITIKEAIDNINDALVDIGITDFSIVVHSEENALYRLQRNDNKLAEFKSFSEGEKMMISFLYFIELCKGESESENVMKKIVVIDDPISSLSHIYVFNVGRLIHNEFLLTNTYEQVFILTHSLYFFYELACMKKDDRDELQYLYRIIKNENGSSIVKMHYEEIQNDYQSYWTIVKDPNSPPALIANCMRNIIEYFFNFVEKQDLSSVFNKKELQENRFAAFNRYINRESHSKGSNIFDLKEFNYDDFRDAFKLVFSSAGYEKHYKAMMK